MYSEKRTKDELESILNQSEYQIYYEDNRNILQIWWDSAKNWLADLLSDWFSSLEQSTTIAGGILIIFVVVVIALLLLASYLTARTVKRNRDFREHKPLQSSNEKNWTYSNHLSEAQKQEQLTHYTNATRHMFLALLLYCHEKEWLEARVWKTNWEYYDELRQFNQDRANQFYNLALLFDQVTYGKRTIQKDEYIDYRVQVVGWLEADDQGQSSVNGLGERWNE